MLAIWKTMQTFYHGTQKLFDSFDLSHAKEGTGLKFGFGVYVTQKYESAAHYTVIRGEQVCEDKSYYVYTVEVPDQTDDNYLFSCRPVHPRIVADTVKRLGDSIPAEVTTAGKLFRKYIGNRLTGKTGTAKKLSGSADFKAEKAASEFLLSIGVDMLIWPQSQVNPDGLQNRAILDSSRIRIVKVESVRLDPKTVQLIPGSEKTVRQ